MRSRTKVKTGCKTCRIRKVKCDEAKPCCQKCVKTGRTCDGYESLFRPMIGPPAPKTPSSVIYLEDIDLLNRYFSTKTIFNVDLGCREEAREVLQASLKDPPIRYAVSSLRSLRKDLGTSGYGRACIRQQSPGYNYGLQQYSVALGGLASKLLSPGFDELRSALLCCQVFISIEQVRGNFSAMASHIIQGLGIMRERRTRRDISAPIGQLPLLDVFIVKLFAAPCKFSEQSATVAKSDGGTPECSVSPLQQPNESDHLPSIAPDMRAELVKIAASTLDFLDKTSKQGPPETISRLLSQRTVLLDALESWLCHLELVQSRTGSAYQEPLSVSFMRFFHRILKIVLLAGLNLSSDLDVMFQAETERLKVTASDVEKRARAYRINEAVQNE